MHSKLWYALDEKDISQKELAKAAGVSEAFISNFVNGLKIPSIPVAKRIADYMGITVDELLDIAGIAA